MPLFYVKCLPLKKALHVAITLLKKEQSGMVAKWNKHIDSFLLKAKKKNGRKKPTCFQRQRQCFFWAAEETVCTHLESPLILFLVSLCSPQTCLFLCLCLCLCLCRRTFESVSSHLLSCPLKALLLYCTFCRPIKSYRLWDFPGLRTLRGKIEVSKKSEEGRSNWRVWLEVWLESGDWQSGTLVSAVGATIHLRSR